MPKTKMKKLSILVTREDMESFFTELVSLGCVEITEAEDFPADSELHALVKREIVDLTPFNANKDSISVLGTKYTVSLTGWLPSHCEPGLLPLLKNCMCAWELSDPSADELDIAPIELSCPWFFGKYRLAGRKLFAPLRLSSEILSQDADAQDEINDEVKDGVDGVDDEEEVDDK